MNTNTAYLLLGSNLADRTRHLRTAIAQLEQLGTITALSCIYETEAWGNEDQPMFLNQAVKLLTSHAPESLLQEVKRIERMMGRTDDERWQPRIIDIDILALDTMQFSSEIVTIPHPQLHLRNFALLPMLDITQCWIHPGLNMTVEEMYLESKDDKEVFIFNEE